jgi:DNA-binding LytR/AlgR family response regulator
MLNCIAVDDEKLVLDLLVDNIKKVPFLHLVKRCRNAMEAADVLHKDQVDLIFLDIQMPGLNGLEFLQSLQNPPMVIFVTAYKEHALEGFNLNAIDYLLKPVSFERFLKACNKAYEFYKLQQKSVLKEDQADYFFVYVEYNLVKVSFTEILYIEGMKDYVKIFITSSPKPVITKMSMKAMEEKLPADKFIRVHKSYIVSADKIIVIKRDLIVIGQAEIPVSDFYKDNLSKITNK